MNSNIATRKRFIAITLFIATVCVVAVLMVPRSTPEVRLVSVMLSETSKTNGLFFVTGESIPFTGEVLERYDDGSIRARALVQDGLLNGVSEGWFADGQLQVREHFKLGIAEGKRRKWHPNGALKSEVEIIEGELEGLFHEWHENGTLAREIYLVGGQAHGTSRSWFPSGYLQARVQLSSGVVENQVFFKDGQTRENPSDSTVSGLKFSSTEISVSLPQDRSGQ